MLSTPTYPAAVQLDYVPSSTLIQYSAHQLNIHTTSRASHSALAALATRQACPVIPLGYFTAIAQSRVTTKLPGIAVSFLRLYLLYKKISYQLSTGIFSQICQETIVSTLNSDDFL